MSDFENDFETVTSEVEPTAEPIEAVEETAAVEAEAADDDFFAEDEAADIPAVDPATVVTIRTSQGADAYVEAPEPMPLVDAVAKCGIRFNGDYTCWLNGQEVGLGTMVAGGQTVTVIGSVKGGVR